MKIADTIRRAWKGMFSNHTLFYNTNLYGIPIELTKHRFGEAEFLNIVQMLTDLYAEVIWTNAVPTAMYEAWVQFVNRNGQRILTELLRGVGFCVIGYHSEQVGEQRVWYFYELPQTAYGIKNNGERVSIYCHDKTQLFYVLKSPTFEQTGLSDHEWCKPFIALLDAVLNATCTTSERLGAYIVMSPKADVYGGTLNDEEKKELEEETSKDYGALNRQRQMMILTRPMDSQVVSLSSVDNKMKDKVQAAIVGIADRLKVPANQIAFIDATSSKALSNGSELREGDISKYRTFRRLLNATFYDMAVELGMKVDYTIENEPMTIQGQTIEQPQTETTI